MPNQYVNKVVRGDGSTIIDLSNDTVTSSDHIMQGYVGHLADGSQVTGTGQGGGTGAISVVDTTDSHGGTVRTITAIDISDTTAVASVVQQGYYFYTADGQKTAGTASGGTPSQTQHTIYFEFSDSTDTTITAYYDSTFISDAITATTPTTYGSKTVDSASLDGVAWYTRPTETWETLLNGNLHVNAGNPYGGVWASDLGDVAITLGSVWRVTIDNGTSYTVTATANGVYGSPNQCIIGNPLFAGGTDDGSNVPFAFERNPWSAWSGWTASSITKDVDHTFKIERLVTA
jgi:hypothetical protein